METTLEIYVYLPIYCLETKGTPTISRKEPHPVVELAESFHVSLILMVCFLWRSLWTGNFRRLPAKMRHENGMLLFLGVLLLLFRKCAISKGEWKTQVITLPWVMHAAQWNVSLSIVRIMLFRTLWTVRMRTETRSAPVVFNPGWFCLVGTLSNAWRHVWVSQSRESAIDTWWEEVRDAAKYPTVSGISSPQQRVIHPNTSGAEVEKPWSKLFNWSTNFCLNYLK